MSKTKSWRTHVRADVLPSHVLLVGIGLLAGISFAASAAPAVAQSLLQISAQNSLPIPPGGGVAPKSTPAPNNPATGRTDEEKGTRPAPEPETALSPTAPAPPPPGPKDRPRIGLALAGGGALAMSEIGTLEWFEEHHIPVDMIAGTSMGSLVGALYATGKTPAQMKNIMDTDVFSSVFRFNTEFNKLTLRRREDSRELPNSLTIGLKHGVSMRNAVLIDVGLYALLDRQFYRYDDRSEFNALPIPYRCVSTDVNDAKTVVFARGSIADAVRASVSLPGIYRPFRMNGHDYVDGGVMMNLPTQVVHDMKPDVILAVSIPLLPVAKGELDSIIGVLQRSFSVAIEQNERESRRLADVLMMPDLTGFNGGDYLRTADLAQRGYAAAEAKKAELMKYALNDAQWEEYLRQRNSRVRGEPGTVLRVHVKAPNADVTQSVQRMFASVPDKPINTNTIDALLADIRADGHYEADYSVTYEQPNRPTIMVTVSEKTSGPPFLDVGLNVAAITSAAPRATLEAIFLYQDLGGYGSELRVHAKAGWTNAFGGEYLRRLSSKPVGGMTKEGAKLGEIFVAPHGEFSRQPYFIYQDQVELSQRQLQTAGGGVDFGWTNRRSIEVRAGWQVDDIRWTSEVGSGSDALTDVFGVPQKAGIRFLFDTQDRALVPRYGMRLEVQAGYLFDAPETPDTPQITVAGTFVHKLGKAQTAHTTGHTNNLGVFNFESGTMFNRNVAQPFRFTLGGPIRLTASAFDEFRGTDYFLVSPIYLHKIASLPAILGQSIFAGVGYEAGQMRAPDTRTVTRQDVYFGLLAETPLGAIMIAPAIGDDGHRKFVFQLGKLF